MFRDAPKIQKMVVKERMFDFLAGLSVEFDQIRIQVLGRDSFPTLKWTNSYIQQEEIRMNPMLHPATYNRSLMIAKSYQDKYSSNHSISSKEDLCCDYYGKRKHMRETC